ncbi:hypothetical protein NBRC116583_25230 [Arenicella sp. 4NH20-0111]|uniref:hypothetical protein n=1 Tax=Arenicella sp. 4NH20-0111 TaxID=3127648 RepID=UPI003102184D
MSPVKEFSERGEPVAFDVELESRDLQLVAANFFQYGHVSRYLDNIGVLSPKGLFIDGYTSVIAIGYQHGDKGFGLRVIGLEHAEVQYCRGLANRGLKQSQISKLVAERSQKVTLKGGSEPYSLAYTFACNTVMWAKPLNEQVSRKLAYRFHTKGSDVSRLWDKVRVSNPDIDDKNTYSAYSEPPLLLKVADSLRSE